MVDPKSKGIRNVLIYVYTGRGGSKLKLEPYDGVKRRMIAANGRFEPHICLARTGDTLELINRDPVGYGLNISFFNNPARGLVLPSGGSGVIQLAKSEPAPTRVDCNIHSWMRSFLVILDHPFAAISDVNGKIHIGGLPANTDLVFRVFHEAGTIDQVQIQGVPTAWNRSRFKLNLSPGVNELGDVLVPGEALLN